MSRNSKNLLLAFLAVLFFLIGYNYWSYTGGYCTPATLMSISLPAILLLVANLVMFLLLLCKKYKNRRALLAQRCACGACLRGTWEFCPDCGTQRDRQN